MSKNLLVSFLYYSFLLGFVFCIAILTYVAGFDIFSKDSVIGNFKSENHHSIGYSYPLKIQTSIPDSVITYLSGQYRYYKDSDVANLYERNNDSIKSKIITETLVLPDFNVGKMKNSLKEKNFPVVLNSSRIISNGYATVNSDSLWIKILLATRIYVMLLSFTIIFYFLMLIFKALKEKFVFSKKLISKTRIIGLVLIFSELIRVYIVYFLIRYINYIEVISLSEGKILDRGVYLNINPRLDFSINFFLLGIAIIILSFLFSEGNRLKQENDLTI